VADPMSWGTLFQTEAAATTKAWSPIEERRVAGMAIVRVMLPNVGVFGRVHRPRVAPQMTSISVYRNIGSQNIKIVK